MDGEFTSEQAVLPDRIIISRGKTGSWYCQIRFARYHFEGWFGGLLRKLDKVKKMGIPSYPLTGKSITSKMPVFPRVIRP